ncbi:MAG: MBL fold metallo-hydrolase [Candidatus Hydrogenedentales bacterium]|jgi:hypothetical protein
MKKVTKKAVAKKVVKKLAKPKNAAKKSAAGSVSAVGGAAKPLTVEPKEFRARIRMYRHGLGDCFLLSFPGRNKDMVHVMIDCGVVLGTANPGPVMTKVAEDIEKTTGGELDVLAITHEHWDHVSGFDAAQARAVFENIKFGTLWLAWTEDETNDLANSLREERERKKAAARAVKEKAAKLKQTDRVARLNGLLGFFGAAAGDSGDEEDDANGGTAGALNYLKGRRKPTILPTGGKPVAIPGTDNVRVYVLGPPAKKSDLNKANPGKGEGYELMSGGSLGLSDAIMDACNGNEKSQPFDQRFRSKLSGMPPKHPYRLPENKWRNIDHDWLAVGERLALQLDSATNNTSLVLAFEFIDSGDVLLFVGDAQAGNWRSWDALSFKVKDANGDMHEVTAADLLARTIFYKVGHHGSHNATLKERGLERMKSDRLAAVIPVDVNVAHNVKGWKRMPLPSISAALKKKCFVLFQSDDTPKIGKNAPRPKFRNSIENFQVHMKDKASKKIKVVRTEHLYCDYYL